MKIAMLFPYAPAYRGPIYELMDREFDVDWYFCGNAKRPLKLYDYSLLKKCDLSLKEEKVIGPIVKFKGIKRIPFVDYDYVICPLGIRNLSLWWLTSSRRKNNGGAKVLFWAHGWYGSEHGFQAFLKKTFIKRFDGMLLYGEYAKAMLQQKGFDGSIIHVLYNSLDYDTQLNIRKCLRTSLIYQEHFNNKNRNIVFIGRLIEDKKFSLLIEAVVKLKKSGFFVNVTFIGDGEERACMEKLVKEKGIEKQVWFYGACYDEQINAELIYNADLCVSPGKIGLTAIHVLMFGCPAITCDDFTVRAPEFEAIKPGVTGDFFKADDSNSLADIIRKWLTDHTDDREAIRNNCFNEIDKKWNTHYQIKVLKDVFNQAK